MLFQWVTVGVADGHICDTVSVFKWCLMKKTKQNKRASVQISFTEHKCIVTHGWG